MIYAFDVDGTLTPSRCLIDARFQLWFANWCRTHTVCLVTGSDHTKTREQLGDMIVDTCLYTLNCSGADVYMKGQPHQQIDWRCPGDIWQWLEMRLYNSSYPRRSGKHFEERQGMLNFSVPGRRAEMKERQAYFEWDCIHREREHLVERLNDRWPDIEASVGGQTSIDIHPHGLNKTRLLDYTQDSPITFFGDQCEEGGNDYPLVCALKDRGDVVHCIDNWETTWDILKKIDPLKNE